MSAGCASRDGRLRPAASEQILGATERAACVVLGSGMGREQGTQRLARSSPSGSRRPLVLDADGLNAHAGRIEALADRQCAPGSHAPRRARWGGCSIGIQRRSRPNAAARAPREAARRSGAIVVLKGDDSIVTDGERVAVNTVSSPQLATAGTGDVLTGVIAALIATGTEPFAATCAAVVAHSRAGRGRRRARRPRLGDRRGRRSTRCRRDWRSEHGRTDRPRARGRRRRRRRAQLPDAEGAGRGGDRALRRGQGRTATATARDTCAAAALRGGATWLGGRRRPTEAEELRPYFPDTPILVMGALTEDELRTSPCAARAEIAVWREGFRELCSRVSVDLGRMARRSRQARQRHGQARRARPARR